MVACSVTDRIAVIELGGTAAGAEGIRSLCERLAEICSGIRREEGVRVVVLLASEDPPVSWREEYDVVFREGAGQPGFFRSPAESLESLDLPVILGIEGDSIGLGLEMALAADVRVASEASRFGLPQVKAGSLPCDGGTQRLARIVGKSKALEMILTGDVIDAREALREGLVTSIVPKGQVGKAAMEIAREMATRGPIAMRYAKEAVLKGMDMTLEQGLRLETDLYLLLHTTRDRSEGITAFREKKRPEFEAK